MPSEHPIQRYMLHVTCNLKIIKNRWNYLWNRCSTNGMPRNAHRLVHRIVPVFDYICKYMTDRYLMLFKSWVRVWITSHTEIFRWLTFIDTPFVEDWPTIDPIFVLDCSYLNFRPKTTRFSLRDAECAHGVSFCKLFRIKL